MLISFKVVLKILIKGFNFFYINFYIISPQDQKHIGKLQGLNL